MTPRERERAKINLDNWKEFQLSDYFHASGTKTTKKESILPGKFVYITTKNTFNGYESSSNEWTEKGNVISIDSATDGACFYQEKNFVASDHVEKIWPKNKELNEHDALFLTTILNFEKHKYSYGRKRNLENIQKEKLLLPSRQNNFDWDYMKNFMKILTLKIASDFKKELVKFDS